MSDMKENQADFGFPSSGGLPIPYGCEGMQRVRMRLIERFPSQRKAIIEASDAFVLQDDFAIGAAMALLDAIDARRNDFRHHFAVRPGPLTRAESDAIERASAKERSRRVYFIQSESLGLIKIGVTGNLQKRRAALQNASGTRLRVLATEPGGLARERELHTKFAALRMIGEWFRPGEDLLGYIGKVKP